MKLTDYLKDTDATPTIKVEGNLGTSLNRLEIETAITEAGFPLPSRDVLFYLTDDKPHAFMVRYFAGIDKYGYERLTLR